MPPRKTRKLAPVDQDDVDGHRQSAFRELAQYGTKTGVAGVLGALDRAGMLNTTVGPTRQVRGELAAAQRDHADVQTPYGTVVQSMELPEADGGKWDFIHPMASMASLSQVL